MVYLVVSLVFSLFVAVFAVQNATVVDVRFFGWQLETSLALLMISMALAGAAVIGVVALLRQLGMGLKLMDERSRGAKADQELQQARLAATELRREVDRLQEANRKLAGRIRQLGAHPPAEHEGEDQRRTQGSPDGQLGAPNQAGREIPTGDAEDKIER